MSFIQHVFRVDMGLTTSDIGIEKTAWARSGHNIGKSTDHPQKGDIALLKRNG